MIFAVTLARGGPWDFSRGLREQEGWHAHAAFMDGLVEGRFLLLGGPLEGERDVLLVVEAASEQDVRSALARDNWHENGMLTIASIRSWTVLLDGLGATAVRGGG